MGKYNEYPLSGKQQRNILLAYFIGWTFILPFILLFLLQAIGIDDEAVFMFANYIIGAIVLYFMARPLFKADKMPTFKVLIKTIVIGFFILLFINVVLGTLITSLFSLETSENQKAVLSIQNINPLLYVVMVSVLAPIVEETVFRGVIFRSLRRTKGFWFSALIAGFCFGFIHVFASLLTANFLDMIFLVQYAALGVVFAKSYEDTGSIYACIAMHGVYNFMGFMLTFL